MFIKWREECKPLTPEEREKIKHLIPAWVNTNKKPDPNRHKYYAYLAESKRIEGKPRQRIITYLGNIPVWAAQEGYGDEWAAFWFKVHCSLVIARVSTDAYRAALGEVERRVLRPDYDKFMEILQDEWKCYPSWKKDYEVVSLALERSDHYLELLYLDSLCYVTTDENG